DPLDRLAVLVQDQRRDAGDAQLGGHACVLIDVDLGDLQRAGLLFGDFIEDRCDHAARSAPDGPEVDQDRHIGLEHFLIERGIAARYGLRQARNSSVTGCPPARGSRYENVRWTAIYSTTSAASCPAPRALSAGEGSGIIRPDMDVAHCRVALDGRFLQQPTTGSGQYSLHLWQALAATADEPTTVLVRPDLPMPVDPQLGGGAAGTTDTIRVPIPPWVRHDKAEKLEGKSGG